MCGISLTHSTLTLFLCGEFVLHNQCCHHFYSGNFYYTSRAVLIFYARSFFYTSRAVCLFLFCFVCLLFYVVVNLFFNFFIFIGGVSLTHPVPASFFSRESLLHIPCWLHFFLSGVSLRHPVLASFLSAEFLLHIPCWLHFYLGNFSYTSRSGFTFMWRVFLTNPMRGVSLTHPVLD